MSKLHIATYTWQCREEAIMLITTLKALKTPNNSQAWWCTPLIPTLWQQRQANLLKPAWSTQLVPQQLGPHRKASGGGWVENRHQNRTNKQTRHQKMFSLQQEPNVIRIHCTIPYTLNRIRCLIQVNKVDKKTP